MRVFLAGATGVIGRALVPMLRDAGHEVVGMTRSEERAAELREEASRRSSPTPSTQAVSPARWPPPGRRWS